MPKKIRELKAMLRKAGFISRSGKGSHTIWRHSLFSSVKLTLSGADGADAQPYQEQDVRNVLKRLNVLKKLKEMEHEE